eukprot:1103548-Prymnesium_polylepis.1
MAKQGVEGTRFQSSAVAGAAATSGDGRGQQEALNGGSGARQTTRRAARRSTRSVAQRAAG